MADQFVNGCGKKPDNVRGTFERLELGGVDPVAENIEVVVVDASTVRKDDVLKAAGLSNVFVLYTIN
jgi:hypothetical protein